MYNLVLDKLANEIRKSFVTAVHSAKSGHPGGSLSSADIFTYLYFEEMNIDPKHQLRKLLQLKGFLFCCCRLKPNFPCWKDRLLIDC